MEVHPRLSFYNDMTNGRVLMQQSLQQSLESTRDLTPLHIPPGPPLSSDRFEELRNTFQLVKPLLKAGQDHGGNEPMLPETHRIYEPPYSFQQKHDYYGSGRDTPLRFPTLTDNSTEYAEVPKYRSPGTYLVEGRYRPFHPYVHVTKINIKAFPYRNQDGSTQMNIPTEADRKPLSPVLERFCQEYELKEPASRTPKPPNKHPELSISSRAANVLENVRKAIWMSTYKRDYTGTGPMNPLLLDDYDMKVIGRATGELGKDVELRESFPSRLNQVRPLEGRIARFLQGRPPYPPEPEQQDSADVQMPPVHRTNDTGQHTYSAGTQNRADLSLGPLQQIPELRSKAQRWVETLLQHKNQPQEYREERYQEKKLPWNNFRKITDTWKTDRLYQRQLEAPPDPVPLNLKPDETIYYEDLDNSRLNRRIVWHNPFNLSKPSTEEYLCFPKPDNKQDVQRTSKYQDTETSRSFPEWIPNCGVVKPLNKIFEIQNSYSKNDAVNRLQDLGKGGLRDLRDHDREGRRHKIQGVDCRVFH